jgi:hypothetical protein
MSTEKKDKDKDKKRAGRRGRSEGKNERREKNGMECKPLSLANHHLRAVMVRTGEKMQMKRWLKGGKKHERLTDERSAKPGGRKPLNWRCSRAKLAVEGSGGEWSGGDQQSAQQSAQLSSA